MNLTDILLKSSEEHVREVRYNRENQELDEEVNSFMTRVLEGETTFLSRVTRGRVIRPRRTMLYGVQGVGKSTWASNAPDPIFLPTEEGVNDIDCDKFPVFKSYEEIMSGIEDLWKGGHDYKTAVLDTLDWMEQLVWKKTCEDNNKKDIEAFGYSKGYKKALPLWREFLDALDALRSDRGMAVILLAHSSIERFESPETESFDRYMPRLNKHAAAIVQEWCDEVFFATYAVFTKVEEGSFKNVAKAFTDGTRIMRTTEKPTAPAKNRLDLPDEMPLIYSEYAKYLTPDTKGNA